MLNIPITNQNTKTDHPKKPFPLDMFGNIRGNYEDRIRDFSSPEKIFSTFATVSKSGEPLYVKYMTLEDFIASLLPFDFMTKSEKGSVHKKRYKEFFDLVDMDQDGLISLSEYILFSTMLSIPEHHIETAFKMFDLDGNGQVDKDEFLNLLEVMKKTNSSTFDLKTVLRDVNLMKIFFGVSGKGTLNFAFFKKFVTDLKLNINSIEFDLYDKNHSGSISTRLFALSIISYCSKNSRRQYLSKLNSLPSSLADQVVSRDDFLRFNRILCALGEIGYVLELFSNSTHSLDKADFHRAVTAVTGLTLTKPQIDVIFFVFDVDNDGNLRRQDLLDALEFRNTKKRDNFAQISGLSRCVFDCFRA